MDIAPGKQAGANCHFRHDTRMGHGTEPSTSVAYVLRQHLRQKKDAVYGLLFLLHDSAGLRATNPIRNPSIVLPILLTLNFSKQYYLRRKRILG